MKMDALARWGQQCRDLAAGNGGEMGMVAGGYVWQNQSELH